jgi:hypothetical protein
MIGPRSIQASLGGTLLLSTLLFVSASSASANQQLSVELRDDCDPASFNAAIGPGTCVRQGSTTFAEFNAQLARDKTVEGWRFNPDETSLRVADSLLATNRGGEQHTFTRVAQFGGSIVPPINAALGNPAPPPECGAALRIASGASTAARVAGSPALPVGQNLFQCCIHPWMRTAVTVRKT